MEQTELNRIILEYLLKNPDASDTLDGITQWWLRIGREEPNKGELLQALQSLCSMGVLKSRYVRGGQQMYSFDKSKTGLVEVLLGKSNSN